MGPSQQLTEIKLTDAYKAEKDYKKISKGFQLALSTV